MFCKQKSVKFVENSIWTFSRDYLLFYLFIYLFIYIFIYLFIYLFIYVSLFPRLRDDCQILKDAESNKTKTYK